MVRAGRAGAPGGCNRSMSWAGRGLRRIWSAYESALHTYPMRTQIATSAGLWCASSPCSFSVSSPSVTLTHLCSVVAQGGGRRAEPENRWHAWKRVGCEAHAADQRIWWPLHRCCPCNTCNIQVCSLMCFQSQLVAPPWSGAPGWRARPTARDTYWFDRSCWTYMVRGA